ncbi:EamA family transporter RarD [Aureimonas pseudogalii]|uniref:Chloramphenicol-sensitive protein RarD n=1 Tax=Aureimonas pseudogalii TaxID=1744844 RepID=A0A7W6MKA9_9HYPH|nr:EamA family transporter RarD [Aureimonas pseudogalii]MBB3998909.1 chloramphenicol-sensitive protein RarD [Aureimonas pseudogalii]
MPAPSAEPPRGFAFAIAAFLIWGLVLPIYMKLLSNVPPLEIVAHRIVWALPLAVAILAASGTLSGIGQYLTPRILGLMTVSAALISVNWGTYVVAIVRGHGVEAALGYYINPLVNVALGAIFLGERPNRPQAAAIALAALGVLILTVMTGGIPWVSLTLAFSFGLYGLLRKTVPIGASEGFFLEIAILFVPALGLAIWIAAKGENHFAVDGRETLLLVGAGVVTAVPLILYAAGARLLRYTTMGLLQYISPTLIALTAVFVFGEPFGLWQGVAFAFIWAALALYTGSLLAGRKAPAPV